MSALGRFLHAETFKWRRSWTLVAVALAPLCQTVNLFLILWFNPFLVRRYRPGFEFWPELSYLVWNLVFLPILVSLVCSISWDQERDAKAWNHLLTQPVARSTHFLVKFLSHLCLVSMAQVLLALLILPGGFLLRRGLDWRMGDFEAGTFLRFAAYSLVATVPLVAFHTWLSARIRGLGAPLMAAVAGTWLCTRIAKGSWLAMLVPWGMTGQIVNFFDRLNRSIPWGFLPGALLVAALVAWLGTRDFSLDPESKN